MNKTKVESVMGATMGKSVHEGALEREMQESKLISTMAMSGVVGWLGDQLHSNIRLYAFTNILMSFS